GSFPMPRSTAESEPFLPRNLMRAASTWASSLAPSSSCLACASNAFSSWIIDAPDTTKKAPETTKAAPVRPTRPREIDAERGLRRGALGDGRKRLRVLEGDVRQHLAVEHDARLLQAGHELRVRQPRQPRGSVDARDPQRAEVAPAHPAS